MGCRTSPYLQEKLGLLGCLTVYQQVPVLVESLLSIVVNQAQVYRICQQFGQALSPDQLATPSSALAYQQTQSESVVYGMVDAGPPVRQHGLHRFRLAGSQIRPGLCGYVSARWLPTGSYRDL